MSEINNISVENEELEYDKSVDFYYTNLINSLILFAMPAEELDKLSGPAFDPMFELEMEIDYAFTPVCFETLFRNRYIDISFKDELIAFKKETDNMPLDIWCWEHLEAYEQWTALRYKANQLLDKLGVKSRMYDGDFVTIIDNKGQIIKKGVHR